MLDRFGSICPNIRLIDRLCRFSPIDDHRGGGFQLFRFCQVACRHCTLYLIGEREHVLEYPQTHVTALGTVLTRPSGTGCHCASIAQGALRLNPRLSYLSLVPISSNTNAFQWPTRVEDSKLGSSLMGTPKAARLLSLVPTA